MTSETTIACIGSGYWGRNLVRNFDCAERAVLDLRGRCGEGVPSSRRAYPRVATTDSVDRVLSDSRVTGVAIATPAETHGELARKALLAGKDVFVEKPLCLSVEEGEDLAKLAAGNGRVLMVGHLLWYHPAVLRLKRLIDEGELGRIQYIYSNRLNLGKIRTEENILWSFAPHDVSVILGLVGEMPAAIHAQGGNYLNDRIADVTVSLLTFPSGVKAHIFVSWLHPFKEQKLVVVGDRKMAVFNDLEKENKLLLYPHSINWKKNLPVASKAEAEPVAFKAEEPLQAECLTFPRMHSNARDTANGCAGGAARLESIAGVPAGPRAAAGCATDAGEDEAPQRVLFRPRVRLHRQRRRDRRRHDHLACIARSEELANRPGVPHRPERGYRPERRDRKRRQDPEQCLRLRRSHSRGWRLLRPLDGVHERLQSSQRDSADARIAADTGGPRREPRSELHDSLWGEDRAVRVRRCWCGRAQGRSGLRARGGKSREEDRLDVRLRKPHLLGRRHELGLLCRLLEDVSEGRRDGVAQ